MSISRIGYIGGADVSAILGISPFKTRLDLFLEKTGEYIPENTQEKQDVFDRGKDLESAVLAMYSRRNNFVDVITDDDSCTFVHHKYPYLVGHVDGIVKDGDRCIIVEAKTSRVFSREWACGTIPEYYKSQVAFYAMLSNCSRVDIPVFFGNFRFEQYVYERDVKYEETILKVCVDFWENNIIKLQIPEPSDACDISKFYPPSEDGECEFYADQSIESLLEEAQDLFDKSDDLKEEGRRKILEIQKKMMSKTALLRDDGALLATWKNIKRKALDVKKFKEDYEDLYNEYCKETESRVFKVCAEGYRKK